MRNIFLFFVVLSVFACAINDDNAAKTARSAAAKARIDASKKASDELSQ